MHTVFVDGLEFHAYHGVAPEERTVGHRFRVDIRVDVEGNAPTSDRIAGTADYSLLARAASDVIMGDSRLTVEFLASAIGRAILDRVSNAVNASVRVAKVHPPMTWDAELAGAEVLSHRTL